MAKATNPATSDKRERINDEYNRMLDIFKNLDTNKLLTITPLLQNCAFMRVTLEDLQKEINDNGIDEIYQHGANQSGTKTTPAISSYNAMIRNYTTVIKELVKLAPANVQKSRLLEMMNAN